MKLFIIAAAAAASMVGSVAFADVSGAAPDASTPYTICAEEARFGWKLSGTAGSTFTDWAANKAIGEVIGDGNCQSGWTMITNIDPRVNQAGPAAQVRISSNTEILDRVVVTNDAGRITAAYQGFAPEVLKGRNNGAGDKWKLVEADGNGGGIYKVKRSGNTSRPRGTELHFTQQMLIDRDNQGGTGATNEYWWRNFRYGASRDTVTTTSETTQYRTVTRSRVFCPSVYDYVWVSPEGEVTAVVNGRVAPCQVRKSTYTVEVGSFTRTNSRTGDKYVTPQ